MLNISIWIVVALGVVCIMLGGSFGIARYRNNGLAKALKQARWQWNRLSAENEQLSKDLQGARDTTAARGIEIGFEIATLQGEKTILRLQNEQFAETIVELNEEVRRLQKSADHATMPLQEATPSSPQKRPTRKKAGA